MKLQDIAGLRQLFLRPRLFICVAAGVLVGFLVPERLVSDAVSRGLLGWNAGALLYVVLAGLMMARSSVDDMNRRAQYQDDGRLTILTGVVIASIASLVAIVAELGLAKDLKGDAKVLHIALAIATILSSWAFTQIMFAIHYAHEYYDDDDTGKRDGGILFPGTDDPDYLDFLYCAAIIGTSGQTADVSFTSRSMRRVALVHSVLAFFFNTTLIALTINIAASFF
jgi:uncharacterized membrane protein